MAIFNFTTSGGTFSLLIDGSSRGTWDKVDEVDSEHILKVNGDVFNFTLQNPYYGNRIMSTDTIQVNGTPLTGSLSSNVSALKDDVFYNAAGGGSTPYLVYTCLFRQSSTNPIVVTELQNTIGTATVTFNNGKSVEITFEDITFNAAKVWQSGVTNGGNGISRILLLSGGYVQYVNSDTGDGKLTLSVAFLDSGDNYAYMNTVAGVGEEWALPEIRVYP